MKRCPSCFRTYADETLTFCLADGSLLSAPYDAQADVRRSDSTPTEVMPRRASFENAQPSATPSHGIPVTPPSLTNQQGWANTQRNDNANAQWNPVAEQGEFLIEHEARARVASLYILMRVLLALTGALTAYIILSALQRFQLSNDVYWAVRIIQRIFIGILLITGQFLLLRKYLKPMWLWILLTLMTVFITTIIEYVLIDLVGNIVFASKDEFMKTTGWAILLQVNSMLPWIFVGVAQWIVLQMRVRRAWLWIVAAIAAEGLLYVVNRLIDSFGLPRTSITAYILSSLCAGLLIGTAQALSLLLFRRKKAPVQFQGG